MTDLFKKIDLKTLIIFGLIIVIFLLNMCSTDISDNGKTVKIAGKTYTVVKQHIDTVVVPIREVVYRNGKDIYHKEIVNINIPVDVDTADIIREYYKILVYKDTLILSDSLGYITLIDTINNNQILNRKWETYVNKITINKTQIVEPLPKNQLFIGGFGGYNNQLNSIYLGPSLLLKSKKDNMFGISVGVGTGKEVLLQGNIYKKIKLFNNGINKY